MMEKTTCNQEMTTQRYSNKEQKVFKTKEKLKDMLTFLQDYLPLANVHSNNFILHNIWDEYLSEDIKKELKLMTDDAVLRLNERMLQNQNEYVQAGQTKATKNNADWTFSSNYLDAAPRTGKVRNLHDIPVFPVEWKHHSIDHFLKDAAQNTLACSGLVSSLDDLICTDRTPLVISNFMTSKKCHEVNIMSDVCSYISKNAGVDVIVDMGSGKGYLSTQLVYQHNLCVVAVDAQTINTHGAQKRASLLGKQWDALVRQAEEEVVEGERKKKGKKYKKRMKKLAMSGNVDGEIQNSNENTEYNVSDEVLNDIQDLMNVSDEKSSNNFCCENMGEISETEKDNLDHLLNDENKIYDKSDDTGHKEIEDKLDCIMEENNEFNGIEHNKLTKMENVDLHDQLSDINNVRHSMEDSTSCEKQSDSKSNSYHSNIRKHENENLSNNNMKDLHLKESKNSKKEKLSRLYYPITVYVDESMDITELVKQTGAHSGEATLMLTGLHTCGSLGSSLQNMFVNSSPTKVLCYVSCCYHLMNEEFVMAPFTDGHEEEKPGFPMSSFLREHEVGLGRAARNFASQTINRPTSEMNAKSYPRSLLQKILYDITGHVDDGWKGLRKLDQKCKDMHQYVQRAFEKLKLPTDKITPKLVSEYVKRYKEEEKKLAIFLQIKSLLAPCIEAIVLLDRYLYLLEQDCTTDVKLVQMFDPVISPRCHAIVAFKE
ncbi:probable methyltransferase-like protein 25 [Mytilus californianus]|uniref:probable methyltransferase-like protein 25 n=1 Tax=Mytilus californianus TaxID=6549 RepID=UPI002247AEBD|nr:probable methyltransferase-like protein 25 [Mytilus californianus]XP_052087977.1 probable methyltransferase-like protein 25 [Mytilus californianus]